MSRVIEFRKNAADRVQQAEKATSEIDREQWLKLEKYWLKLADETDEYEVGP